MTTHIKPHQQLIEICMYLNSHDDIKIPCPSRGENWHSAGWTLISTFKNSPTIVPFHFTDEEVLILARIWFQVVRCGTHNFTSFEILNTVITDDANYIDQLDIIIGLLEKQVLYTTKKQIIHGRESHESTKRIRYTKRTLLDEDISIHHNFVNLLLGEPLDVDEKSDTPYSTNKAFLADWFTYVEKLYELRNFYDFKDIRFDEDIEGSTANDLLDVFHWQQRIENRRKITQEIFPLSDITEEYALDENETTILVYLVKEDLSGSNVDTDELLKLISPDPHALYNNRRYLSIDSTLVKRGLVEISENIFMRSRGSEVRATPDIMKQIILDTPINDEERLNQILKGNEIFTLIDPNYTMDDLILQPELKDTIVTAIGRYSQNIDSVLASWNLYDGRMDVVGQVKKKTEPGLLMLLHGPSGTGKTFASGAIAKHLGKKLLITDISRLQSMWVGESEKNVKRLFTIFERIVRRVENPPVLLLNEADQFLATRMSDTSSSIDQMQNSIQNIFLEGFERLRGVMIATTNLQENMDSAFSRRFHLKLELPQPSETERIQLWQLHLPPTIPRSKDIDIEKLSSDYILTGGQIKIIIQNAAAEAASRKGKAQVLRQNDLMKYCELETINGQTKTTPMGFAIS